MGNYNLKTSNKPISLSDDTTSFILRPLKEKEGKTNALDNPNTYYKSTEIKKAEVIQRGMKISQKERFMKVRGVILRPPNSTDKTTLIAKVSKENKSVCSGNDTIIDHRCLFLVVPWVGLWFVIMTFSGDTCF